MNPENSTRKILADISGPNVSKGEYVLYLLPFLPIICEVIGRIENITHDAIEHRYDIKVKVGPVDIALTKNNKD